MNAKQKIVFVFYIFLFLSFLQNTICSAGSVVSIASSASEKKELRKQKRLQKKQEQEKKARAISKQDTTEQKKLDLSGARKLPQKLIDDKKEGSYWTGIGGPLYTPDIGLGFAAVVNFFKNGYRNEPTFSYIPYRENVMLSLGSSIRGVHSYWINYRAPYLRNLPIHLNFHAGILHNIVSPYYGLGSDSQKSLTTPNKKTFKSYSKYNKALRQINHGITSSHYNFYTETKPETHLSIEYNLPGGKIRLLAAVTFSYFRIQDYTNKKVSVGKKKAIMQQTLLNRDFQANKILGYSGGFDNYITFGLVYDSRDFAPDPNKGMYHELTFSQSAKVFGSSFNYYDITFALRGYLPLFPYYVHMVLAGRFSYHVKGLDVPFYVMKRLIYIDENVTGLGGSKTLRGFSDARFAGPVMMLANIELRYTFARWQLKDHILKFKIVPFIEFGRSYDTPEQTTLKNLNVAGGVSFAISWNLASIITLDVGFSREDIAAYFSYGNNF